MNKLGFLFLLTFLFIHSFASAQFIAPVRISKDNDTIGQPFKCIPGDIDQDGDQDILVIFKSGGNIMWYENMDGEATMSEPRLIANFGFFGIQYINLVDIDNDGALDLFGINNIETNQVEVFWMKNTLKETATFSEPIMLQADELQRGVEAKFIDFNQDNIGDIVIADGIQSVVLFEGINNKGGFDVGKPILTKSADFFEISDLDSDGDFDIVITRYNGEGDFELSWFEKMSGQSQFSDEKVIGIYEKHITDLQISDINSDGNPDVILGITTHFEGQHHYFWYQNNLNDNGTWIKHTISDTVGIAPPIFIDLDTDGDIDFLTTEGGLRVFENMDGKGQFHVGETLSIFCGTSLSLADLNGDGILDVITTRISVGQVDVELGYILLGKSNLQFSNPIDFITDVDEGSGVNEHININGDEYSEIFTSHSTSDRFAWQSFNQSSNRYSNPHIIDLGYPKSTEFTDIDADGDQDIIAVMSKTKEHVVWYEKLNDELNYSPAKILFTEHQSIVNVIAIDFDQDGDQDIVFNKNLGDKYGINWLENIDGQGNFSEYQVIKEIKLGGVRFLDVDKDGDQDIVGVDINTGFHWLENENNVFSNSKPLLEISWPYGYLIEDLTGNGWEDIIFYGGENFISIYKNSGGVADYGNVVNLTGLDPFQQAYQLLLKDIDLDGDKDLLIRAKDDSGSHLFLFEADGGPNVFAQGVKIYTFPENISWISIDDYDGDSDLDMIINSSKNRSMHFVENVNNQTKIIGKTFLDVNENNQFDTGEITIYPKSFSIQPKSLSSYPNANGIIQFSVEEGLYNISCDVNSDFTFTNSSSVEINVTEDSVEEVNFGIIPISEKLNSEISISSSPTRCGFEVPFWIDFRNLGTIAGDMNIAFQLDPNVEFINATPTPDSIVQDIIYWNHKNLNPTKSGQIQMFLKIPGEEFVDQYLLFKCTGTLENPNNQLSFIVKDAYRPLISCAIDPNDKMVTPSIIDYDNYTIFGDTLTYTIRFQNMGTDTAFNIMIEDYLDRNFNYSSLHFVGSSHPFEALLHEPSGRLTMNFKNILLPDSMTNLIESQGYIKYKIQHKESLPEYTYIQNYADIFFDFNQPVRTNTVENILVSNYPVEASIANPSCHGLSDGKINIISIPPFYDSIVWNNGATKLILEDLIAGTYNAKVYFSNGAITDTTFIVKNPELVNTIVKDKSDISCFGFEDGFIEITTAGGTPPYIFEWSNSSNTKDQYNLPDDNYTLIVQDSNLCKDTLEVEILPAEEIKLNIEVSPEFDNMMNGSIEIEPEGGKPPYTYAWDFDSNQSTNIVNGLSYGSYIVTITDANLCSIVETIEVDNVVSTFNENDIFDIRISPNPSSGEFNIQYTYVQGSNAIIKIYNELGQIAKSETLLTSSGQLSYNLPSGVYHIYILIDSKFYISKPLIIQ